MFDFMKHLLNLGFLQIYEIVRPPPVAVEKEDIALLKSCPLLKVDPVYGGNTWGGTRSARS